MFLMILRCVSNGSWQIMSSAGSVNFINGGSVVPVSGISGNSKTLSINMLLQLTEHLLLQLILPVPDHFIFPVSVTKKQEIQIQKLLLTA